jgi:hypothetical protein
VKPLPSGVPRIPFPSNVLRRVNSFPDLFPQSLQAHDGKSLLLAQGVIEDADDFLGHRTVLSLSLLLKPLVERIGKILDGESRHGVPLRVLQRLVEIVVFPGSRRYRPHADTVDVVVVIQ